MSWALLEAGLHDEAAASAQHVFALAHSPEEASFSLTVGLRAYTYLISRQIDAGLVYRALEWIESCFELIEAADASVFYGEPGDRLVQILGLAETLSEQLRGDEYREGKAAEFVQRLRGLLEGLDPALMSRRLDPVKDVVSDKFFAFIRPSQGGGDYFFHLRDLVDQGEWQFIAPRVLVAYTPNENDPRGRRGAAVRLLA